jgi:riboflavin biosynthesis pyrimidine reductase
MQADSTRARELTRRGAILLPVPLTAAGLSLPTLLQVLHERGIHSVMVEGGARVLASFVRQGLADRLIVTVAPRLVGGLPALSDTGPFQPPIRLENVACYPMPDGDLTVCAQFPASSMI